MAIEVNCEVISQELEGNKKSLKIVNGKSYDAKSLNKDMPKIDSKVSNFETKQINGGIYRMSDNLSRPAKVSKEVIKMRQSMEKSQGREEEI